MASSLAPQRQRQPPKARSQGDDAWVDQVADQVQDLLKEQGLEMELLVFYDSVTEVLHATGFDGAPARYFRGLEAAGAPSGPSALRGTPMSHDVSNPEQTSPETNEQVGA